MPSVRVFSPPPFSDFDEGEEVGIVRVDNSVGNVDEREAVG